MSTRHLRIRRMNGEMHIIRNQRANGYNIDLFLAALQEELARKGISSEGDDEKGSFVQHYLYVGQKYSVMFQKGCLYVKDEEGEGVFISHTDELVYETTDWFYSDMLERQG